MHRDWLPGFCSRLSIFLSYSSEHRPLAEKIAQTLKNDGHRVFFDQVSLPPASDYNAQIRKAVWHSDRFIFLASHSAFEEGKYTLTELDFAKQRWPSPVGRVFPVIIDPELRPEALPTYLSSVQTLRVTGNAPAEIAATIERTRSVQTACWTCLGISTLALSGIAGIATGVISIPNSIPAAEVVTVAPQYVHFRPRQRPPDDPSAPDADTSWSLSPVTLSLSVAYSSRNVKSAPAQVLAEDVELKIGDRNQRFSAAHVVQISGTSVSQSMCGADWLCVKSNWKVETLAPGATIDRETMFLPLPDSPMTWRELVDPILSPSGPSTAQVHLRTRTLSADGSKQSETTTEVICGLDLAGLRQRLLTAGFKSGQNPRPPILQPNCQKK